MASKLRSALGIMLHILLSTILAVTSALWIRSYWFDEGFVYVSSKLVDGDRKPLIGYDLMWGPHGLRFQTHEASEYYDLNGFSWESERFRDGVSWGWPRDTLWNKLGFWYRNPYNKASLPSLLVSVPAGLPPLLVFLILLPLALQPLNRFRRSKQGKCQNCGYDLRASGERCPECGLRVAPNQRLQLTGSARDGQ